MRWALALAAVLIFSGCSIAPSTVSQASPRPSATPTASPTDAAPPTIEELLNRCPTPAELASVDSSVPVKFTSDPSAGVLVCRAADGSRDLTLLQERAYQAVLMFTWIRFDAPLPWTNLTLDKWFAHAIGGVA